MALQQRSNWLPSKSMLFHVIVISKQAQGPNFEFSKQVWSRLKQRALCLWRRPGQPRQATNFVPWPYDLRIPLNTETIPITMIPMIQWIRYICCISMWLWLPHMSFCYMYRLLNRLSNFKLTESHECETYEYIGEPTIVGTRRPARIWCKKSRTDRCKNLVALGSTPHIAENECTGCKQQCFTDPGALAIALAIALACPWLRRRSSCVLWQGLQGGNSISPFEKSQTLRVISNCFPPCPLHGQEIYEKQKRLGRLWLYFADHWDHGSMCRQKCHSHPGSNQQEKYIIWFWYMLIDFVHFDPWSPCHVTGDVHSHCLIRSKDHPSNRLSRRMRLSLALSLRSAKSASGKHANNI